MYKPKTAISTMDTVNATSEEELEINLTTQELEASSKEQRKPRPLTEILCGESQQTPVT